MTPTLQQRLRDAKAKLDDVHAALRTKPSTVSVAVEKAFRPVVDCRSDIDHWLTMIGARTAAWQLLDGLENKLDADSLESKLDADELVPFGDARAKFVHVRQLGVQAYLATTWALADQITGMAGRVLCTPEFGFNEAKPARLVSHFINKDRKSKTAGVMYDSLRFAFGWPVGVSYAIRNHFVHGGDRITGPDFFEASTTASAFRISDKGWAHIEETARKKYEVNDELHRTGASWPVSPRDDLREVLRVCEREMDDALGVIIGSACHTLFEHVRLMLGEDQREVERSAHKP